MKALLEKTSRFLTAEDGPTVTEYAVMLALIVLVAVAAISLIGGKVQGVFARVESSVPDGAGM